MRALTKTLLAFVAGAFFLTSCGGDPTASNPDIKQMSDASKKALDESAKVSCGCLKTNGKDLKEAASKMKPILAEAEKAENPIEVLKKMREVTKDLKGLEAFGECMKDARPGKGDEAVEKALEDDMKKIMGEKPDFKAVSEKRKELSLAFLKKNCPSEAKILEDVMKVEEDASALRKKKREEEK